MKFTAAVVAVLSLALGANAQVRGKDALVVENERRLSDMGGSTMSPMSTMTPGGEGGMGGSTMSPMSGSTMSPMSTMSPGGMRELNEKKDDAW